MFTGTINEFATLCGVEYQEASGLYRYLKHKGIAKDVKTQPNKAKKGRPAVVFTVPDRVELVFPIQKTLPVVVDEPTPHNATNGFGAADTAEDIRKEESQSEVVAEAA